jgi:predicted AAA+ superfamily ATPase
MKEIFKLLINDFFDKKFNVKKRDINIPLNSNKIVTLVGVRRSGKTYALYNLINELRKKIDTKNIIYINFEDDRLFGLKANDLSLLIDAYFEMYPQKRDEEIYLFLDEIQEIDGWEKFVRRIYDTLNIRIFLTGSSAKMLSVELASSLRGRTITYEIYPLSFKEYLEFKNIDVNLYSSKSLSFIKNQFEIYLKEGGFPEIAFEKDKDIKQRILRDYVNLIIYKDIIDRYNIKNLSLLKFLIRYTFSNLSTLISFNKLYNELKTLGYKLSKDTLFEYFNYLNDAYALFLVPIFRSSIKEEQRNPKKMFIVDNGFNYIYNTSFSNEYSKLYENLVFLHLKRKYKEIYYFKEKQEVDFFVPESRLLINVSFKIDNQKTFNREISALKEAMEKYKINKSYLITSDEEKEIDDIKIIPLWKFLLSKM